jgi:hypothetical protein
MKSVASGKVMTCAGEHRSELDSLCRGVAMDVLQGMVTETVDRDRKDRGRTMPENT